MKDHWVAVADIAPHGSNFTLEDMEIWDSLIQEFQLECRLTAPLRAYLHVQPMENGLLVRGSLKGDFFMPCSRCAEETAIVADESFEHFVPLLSDEEEVKELCAIDDDQFLRCLPGRAPELNIAALCAEEFVLALPVKALCRTECKGLCPLSGTNLNEKNCACDLHGGDPRLAALRNMKVTG